MNSNKSILFLARGPYGTLGMNASYMIPKTLNEKGFKVKVLSFNDNPSVGKVISKNCSFVSEVGKSTLIERVKFVRQVIDEFKPDIIHMFTMPNFSMYPYLCSSLGRHKPKWLIDVRSPPLRQKPQPIILKPIRFLLNLINQSGFYCITSHVLQSAKDSFSFVYKPLCEVRLGVDFDAIRKKKWEYSTDVVPVSKFVYIGSVAKLRCLDTLLYGIQNACSQLKSDSQFTIDFWGNGDDLDNLKKLTNRMDLNKVVSFQGVINQNDLFDKICEYDVGIGYVPYGQYRFSPALKVIEYMAANIGVLASDTEGVKVHVKNGNNGSFFENNPKSIGDQISTLVTNGYPAFFLKKGLKTAKECSWETVVDEQLLPVYKKMFKEKASA